MIFFYEVSYLTSGNFFYNISLQCHENSLRNITSQYSGRLIAAADFCVIFPRPLASKTQPLVQTHPRTGQRFKASAVLFLKYVCCAEGVFAVILFFGFCHYAPKIKRSKARLICCFTIQIFKFSLWKYVFILDIF